MKRGYLWVVFCLAVLAPAGNADDSVAVQDAATSLGVSAPASGAATAGYQAALNAFNAKNYVAFTQAAAGLLAKPDQLTTSQTLDLQWHRTVVPYMQNQWDAARLNLEAFVAAHPDTDLSLWAKFLIAQSYFNQGSYGDFRQRAEAFLTAHPQSPDPFQADQLRFNLAYAPYLQEKWAEATASLDQFANNHPQAAAALQARYLAIHSLYNMGSLDQFRQRTAAFLVQQPAPTREQSGWLKYYLAMADSRQGKPKETGESLERLLNEAPGAYLRGSILYALTGCYNQQQKYEAFQQKAQEFLAKYSGGLNPHVAEQLRLDLAMVPFHQGKWTEAKTALEQFTVQYTSPDLIREAKFNILMCALNLKRYEEYKAKAQDFLTQYPGPDSKSERETLQLYLARTLGEQSHWAEEAQAAAQYISSSPSVENLCSARLLLWQALAEQSGVAAKAGDNTKAAQLRQQAAAQMAECRVGAERTLAETDNIKPMVLVLEHHLATQDFDQLTSLSQKLTRQYAKPSQPWAAGHLFLGIARASQQPPDLKGAAEALDTLLAAPVIDDSLIDHLPTKAAYWRAGVAQMQGDTLTAIKCVKRIRDEMPDGPAKKAALEQYKVLLQIAAANKL